MNLANCSDNWGRGEKSVSQVRIAILQRVRWQYLCIIFIVWLAPELVPKYIPCQMDALALHVTHNSNKITRFLSHVSLRCLLFEEDLAAYSSRHVGNENN